MQVRFKIENGTEIVKHIRVKFSPVEWLAVKKAMRCFAENTEENAEDRKIMERLLAVKPTYKYEKATEGKDAGKKCD